MTNDKLQQEEELLILKSILGDAITEISTEHDQFEIDIDFRLPSLFYLRLIDVAHQLSAPIHALPPLILTVTFHDTYPSSIHSPTFVLSSCYLSRQHLEPMCQALDALWEQNLSEPIVFQWVECLKEHFASTNELCLSTAITESEETNDDPRAMSSYEPTQAAQIYEQLLQYNREQENENFLREYHECSICMASSIPGKDMVRLYKCHHAFCRACLHDYAQMHINTGSVEWLLCPDSQCQLALLPMEIKRVVDNNQLYDKYERLLLQKSLEQMLDIVWCPRCQQAVLTGNETDNLALCDQCHFAFCKKCKETYHSQTICGRDLRLTELFKRRKQIRNKLQALSMTPEQEAIVLREILATATIETTTRFCPNPKCETPIEKNGGCNHMYCVRCHMPFDWDQATEHTQTDKAVFDSFRNDFDKMQLALERERHSTDQQLLEERPGESLIISTYLLARAKTCPYKHCGEINIKSGLNNYLICQKCKRGFCFSCGKTVISVNQHFGQMCKPHSTL